MTPPQAISGRPLRLLVLADAASIHTEKWILGLSASGPVELHLLTMNPAGPRPALRRFEGVDIEECYAGPVAEGGGNWRYLLNLPSIRRAVRRIDPDAIVTIYLSSYGLMGALARGDAALAHVMIGTDIMVTPSRNAIYRGLARFALRRGDLFVSASRAISARLATLARIPDGKILTQQYGLEDWVIAHPVLPKDVTLVSNRAWVPNSNIPQLLRIFGRVRGAATLAVIGSGGSLETDIRREAGSDGRVTLLGALEYRQNIEVIARSAFYISMTSSDGASLSLMEAMALGAVPMVSDIEPNREWVEDGVNGLLLPLSDEAAAAARIESFLRLPAGRLEAMREHNRAIIRERGSLTRNTARFRERLEAVLAARRRGNS
jgi:glycosyltransferase involved in cell wall biosynthesis